MGIFRPIFHFISKMVQDTATVRMLEWKTNRNSYAIYRMVPFPMTINDP